MMIIRLLGTLFFSLYSILRALQTLRRVYAGAF